MVISKTQLAKDLGVSRSSLYYKPKLPAKDEYLKQLILKTWANEDPAYGHKRLSPYLKVNKKRVKRVMRKFGLRPPRRRVKKPNKPEDFNKPATKYPNLLWDRNTKEFISPTKPDYAWAQDFTYIWFMGRFWYLATVIDIFTREIMGFAISDTHDTELVLQALKHALKSTKRRPQILHSDQGSEYTAAEYIACVEAMGVTPSFSDKGSPWQNGFQESYYSNFKLDLGNADRFSTVGELSEAIYRTIHKYNETRIHTSLNMSPRQFYKSYQLKLTADSISERLSKEMGT